MARATRSWAAVRFSVLLLFAAGVFGNAAQAALPLIRPMTSADSKARLSEFYGKLPFGFEANQGQTDPAIKFNARRLEYQLFLNITNFLLTSPIEYLSVITLLLAQLRLFFRKSQKYPLKLSTAYMAKTILAISMILYAGNCNATIYSVTEISAELEGEILIILVMCSCRNHRLR